MRDLTDVHANMRPWFSDRQILLSELFHSTIASYQELQMDWSPMLIHCTPSP
jgi:hypothetical protein